MKQTMRSEAALSHVMTYVMKDRQTDTAIISNDSLHLDAA